MQLVLSRGMNTLDTVLSIVHSKFSLTVAFTRPAMISRCGINLLELFFVVVVINLKSLLSQVSLGARSQEVHTVAIESNLGAVGRKENLLGGFLLFVLFLHDSDVSLGPSTPVTKLQSMIVRNKESLISPVVQFIVLLIFCLLGLKVKEDLPGVVTLVEEVEVVEHGGVIEHVVHDLVPQQAAELPDQLEGELVGRVNLSPPRL